MPVLIYISPHIPPLPPPPPPPLELYILKETDPDSYQDILKSKLFNQINIIAKSKQEIVNDEQKLKTIILKLEKIDYSNECRMLIDAIERY